MKNSKKGFTLTEVLIVTAIIVILSGAAIAGIAVTVSNAKERGEKIQASQGVNWESEAVLKVKKTKIELGNEQIYEESADTPTPEAGGAADSEGLSNGSEDSNTENDGNDGNDSNTENDGNDGNDGTDLIDGDNNEKEPVVVDPPTVNSTGVTANSGAVLTSDSTSGVVLKDYSSEWGSGSVNLYNNEDMQSYGQYTITIDAEKSGEVTVAGEKYQVSPGTNTIVVNNKSNPYWTDPTFSKGSNLTVYFNFGNSNGQYYNHGMSITVQAS